MTKPVIDIFRSLVLAGVLLLGIATTPSGAAPSTETLFGEYLADLPRNEALNFFQPHVTDERVEIHTNDVQFYIVHP